MLADQSHRKSSGTLSSGVETDGSIKAIVSFIKANFKLFAEKNKGSISKNEKGLTQLLCIHLNKNAKECPFFFHSEFMEDTDYGGSPQVDIGTISYDEKITISDNEYHENDSFFSIEAKRLPTPGANREKEYVIGYSSECGGIERFKKGIHGNKLKYGAIIGYVQKETFDHWFVNINSWIQELIDAKEILWDVDDRLTKSGDGEDSTTWELFSENTRHIKGEKPDKISLFHFWITLI